MLRLETPPRFNTHTVRPAWLNTPWWRGTQRRPLTPAAIAAAAEVRHHGDVVHLASRAGLLSCSVQPVPSKAQPVAHRLAAGAYGVHRLRGSPSSSRPCTSSVGRAPGIASGAVQLVVAAAGIEGEEFRFNQELMGQTHEALPGIFPLKTRPEPHRCRRARCPTFGTTAPGCPLVAAPLFGAGLYDLLGRRTVARACSPPGTRATGTAGRTSASRAMVMGVAVLAADAEFEMQVVRARGPARRAHGADLLPLVHGLAFLLHVDAAQVGVDGDMLVAVLDVDHVAIAVLHAGEVHHPVATVRTAVPVGQLNGAQARQVLWMGCRRI